MEEDVHGLGDAYAVCVLDQTEDDEWGAAAAARRVSISGWRDARVHRGRLLVDYVGDAAPVEHPCTV